jgi:hypothetical protein
VFDALFLLHRPVIIQPKVVEEDLRFLLQEIDRLGGDL